MQNERHNSLFDLHSFADSKRGSSEPSVTGERGRISSSSRAVGKSARRPRVLFLVLDRLQTRSARSAADLQKLRTVLFMQD